MTRCTGRTDEAWRAAGRSDGRPAVPVMLLVLAVGLAVPASAQDTTPASDVPAAQFAGEDEGLRIHESADQQFRVVLDARLLLDAAFYHEDKNPLSSGAELRRARLSVKAIVWRTWWTELDADIADGELEVKDAWLGWAGLGTTVIRAGQFREPFGLEQLTSSRYTTFMERGLPDALAPGRHVGLGVNTWGRWWQAAGGVFGEEAGAVLGGQDQGWGASARVSVTPFRQSRRVLHLGIASAYRTPDADVDRPNRVRFRSLPEAHVDQTHFLNTGRMRDIDHTALYGGELAGVWGPFSLQGEYAAATVRRLDGATSIYGAVTPSPAGF